jgi:hypothetical protein
VPGTFPSRGARRGPGVRPADLIVFAALLAVIAALTTGLIVAGSRPPPRVSAKEAMPIHTPAPTPKASSKTGHRSPAAGHVLPTHITSLTNPYEPTAASGGRGHRAIAPPGPTVTLCSGPSRPGHNRITYGMNQVFDNAWLGHMCIRASRPGYFEVASGLPSKGDGNVKAYPDVWTGTHYGHHTPGSFLPMPVSQVMNSSISASAIWSFPTEPSFFLADFDAWTFANATDVHKHGDAEIIIVVNNIRSVGTPVYISGRWWHEKTWLTCSRLAGGGCDPAQPEWPILMFAATQNIMNPDVSMAPFFQRLVNQGYLARSQVLGSIHFGFECWTGCAGGAAWAHFSG